MPVSRYMQMCLTHPQYGYYLKRDPLGRDGDFITAPEVSQMFGELVGLWAASVWNAMGMPEHVMFIELGPGRGTMMADALARDPYSPGISSRRSASIWSRPVRRCAISSELSSAMPRMSNGTTASMTVPEGPAIILANEYFDALPIHQAVKRETGWHERVIEMDDEIFAYGVANDPMPRFEVLLPPHVRAAPNGAIFEWRPNTEIMTIARRVRDHGGAALIIDYGHVRSDAGDTFQAVAKHAFANPLQHPGDADVTAHVDFQALARAAEDIGARAHGPVEQGAFLNRLGIETRAQTLMKNASAEQSAIISSALKRLTGSGKEGMGSLFKVLRHLPSLD